MAPRRNARRGVVLLLILSLLILFSLLGLTFLISATRYRHGAESFGKHDLRGDDPAKLLDQAVDQLIRGPNNPYSSMWGQDLLMDLYGRDGTGGVIGSGAATSAYTVNQPVSNDVETGEILRVDVQPTNFDIATFGDPSTLDDFYAGSVFSVLNGPDGPRSTRVVRYIATKTAGVPAHFYLEGFGSDTTTIRNYINNNPNTVAFLVNGKPFNGSGFGFSLVNGGQFDFEAAYSNINQRPYIFPGNATNASEQYPVQIAIEPHYAAYLVPSKSPTVWGLPRGDGDESYDALDYQNMFLARNPPGGANIVASFHRPHLINYLLNDSTLQNAWGTSSYLPGSGYRSFRRRFVFRPMPWDHPNFTGGNPNLVAATAFGYTNWTLGFDTEPGRAMVDDDGDGLTDNLDIDADGDGTNDYSSELGWPGSDDMLANDDALVAVLINAANIVNGNNGYDVDNDGDGINDSFWVDLQLPPKTAPDGRLYKPLVAFLVSDLDGRLDVNAGGSLAQTQTAYHSGNALAPTPGSPPQSLDPLAARPFAGLDGDLSWLEPRDIDGNGTIDVSDAQPNNRDNTGDSIPDRPAHGEGYGPAAINLRHLFDDPNRPWDVNDYQQLLLNRYGPDGMPGSAAIAPDFLTFLKGVGRPDIYASANNLLYGSWDNPSAFFSPPDYHERGTLALNCAGQPIRRYAGTSGFLTDVNGNSLGAASERTNHPYEANLVRPNGDDRPFTPAELEGLLRWRDRDAGQQAKRLFSLVSDTTDNSPSIDELSKLITVRSAYIPAPPTVPLAPDHNVAVTDLQLFELLYPTDYLLPLPSSPTPPQPNPRAGTAPNFYDSNAARIAVRLVDTNGASPTYGQVVAFSGVGRMPSIFDLMAAKVVQGCVSVAPSGTSTLLVRSNPAHLNALQAQVNAMLAFELRHGQKMDPNRLWGNGEDGNGNYSIDEQYWDTSGMTATAAQETDGDQIWTTSPNAGYSGGASYLNDDPVYGAGKTAFHPRGREMYARHLYCLMMLMVDADYYPANSTFYPPPGEPQRFGFMEPYIDPSITTDQQRRELTIRRIAQWAINAVDFRDADAIMTPFEYDVNPWNGWNVDGDIATDETQPPNPANPGNDRRVIWGCEQPDVLITETFALHDQRKKDTKLETGTKNRNSMPMPDTDLDQIRVPQGSLFLELYCPPRNFHDTTNNGVTNDDDLKVAPRELYRVDANGVRLNLGALAPADNYGGATLRYPVWRMAISESYSHGPKAGTIYGPDQLINAGKRDNVSFQPYTPDEQNNPNSKMYLTAPSSATAIPDLPIERLVWFTNQSPAAFPAWEQNHVYYNRFGYANNAETLMNAGEYLVVGPRAVTHVGSQDDQMTYPDYSGMKPDTPSAQILQLVTDVAGTATPRFTYTDYGYPRRYNVDAGAPQVKVARTIVAAADPPTTWVTNPLNETANVLAGVPNAPIAQGVGLSISEPLRHQYYAEPTDFIEGAPTTNYPLRDAFYDVVNSSGGPVPNEPFDVKSSHVGYLPIRDDGLARTQRYPDYKSVFLQRLANPLLPWNATLNPYITVDWHSIDLTVFNGEDRQQSAMGQWDPSDNNPNPLGAMATRPVADPPFGSRERVGQTAGAVAATINYGLYSYNTSQFNQSEGTRATDYFSLDARHSLGYLNRQVDSLSPTAYHFVNTPNHPSAIGDPSLPFEWLTWNDRPYVSHLEMMQVPASSAGRLTYEFNHRGTGGADPYLATDYGMAPAGAADPNYFNYRSPFGHLLNFFQTSPKNASTAPLDLRGANYYRILDFVEVPSRFAGTEKWYNPSQIRLASASANDVIGYRAPFNWLSRFSDPGRVNLNTAWDWRIWAGVSEGFPQMATQGFWENSGAPIDSIVETMKANGGAALPSEYPNPLRAASAGTLGPMDSLRQDGVEATLLRSFDPTVVQPAPHQPPLFNNRVFNDNTTAPANVAIHPQPNPYFRYQGMQRLGNLVSGQSNVFAVWVTVGYFQVDPIPDRFGRAGQDAEHPDGFTLGPEIGIESGQIVRHRAFYTIDRSIPAAYQPGVNHNIEKTILLRRFIE